MKVINRKTVEVVNNKSRALRKVYLSLSKNVVYFTSVASDLCGLSDNSYVNFINDGDEWRFFVNDDTDGFKACIVNKVGKRPCYRLHNSGLVNMILKSTGHLQKTKRFVIEKTGTFQDRSPIFRLSQNNIPADIK